MRKTIAMLALVAGAAFGVTACAGPADFPPEGTVDGPVVDEGDQYDPEQLDREAENEAETEAERPDVLAFGDTAQWDGVEVTLSEPMPFTPSEYAAGAEEFDESVAFQVTLTNTGEANYDPSMAMLAASAGDRMASEVFDEGTGEVPTVPVRPGKSVTWTVAFNVSDPSEILVEVTPGLEYQVGHEEDFNTYSALFAR